MLQALYTAVCHRVQTRFERARSVKHEVSHRGRANPQRIATELLNEIDPSLMKEFPTDFLPTSFAYREIELPHDVVEVERLTFNRMRAGDQILDFSTPEEAEFVQFALEGETKGTIRMPIEAAILQEVVARYRSYLHQLDEALDRLASSRTADRKLKVRIKDALRQQLGKRTLSLERQAKLI